MRHTPGPWEVEAVKSVKGPMQVESIDFYAVTSEHAITKLKTVADLVDNPADAHLIAAAPDMLVVLETIQRMRIISPYQYATLGKIVDDIIAKAKGESHEQVQDRVD